MNTLHLNGHVENNTNVFFLAVADPRWDVNISGWKFRLTSHGSRYVPSSRNKGEYVLRKEIDDSFSILVGPPMHFFPDAVRRLFSRLFH